MVAGEFVAPDFSKVISARTLQPADPQTAYEFHISKLDGSEDVLYHTGRLAFTAWAPDSAQFALWSEQAQSYYLGKVGADLAQLTEPSFVTGSFAWVDATHFIYLGGENGLCELRLGTVGAPSMLVAASETPSGCISYDWVK